MTAPTVAITDAFADAVRVDAATVAPGDLVFDPMGRTYPVKSVRVLKDGTARIIREDGVWSYHDPEYHPTITVIRNPAQ